MAPRARNRPPTGPLYLVLACAMVGMTAEVQLAACGRVGMFWFCVHALTYAGCVYVMYSWLRSLTTLLDQADEMFELLKARTEEDLRELEAARERDQERH